MILLGLLLSFILGLTVLLAISSKFRLLEYIFLSFPIGIGFQTFLMMLLDWFNLGISRMGITSFSFLLIAALGILAYKKIRNDSSFAQRLDLKSWVLPKPNLVWILFIGLIVWFEWMNFYKTVYLPTFDTDSIRGFDFLARAMSIEGTLKGVSLITNPNYPFQGDAGLSSYAPFAQFAYTYAYLFGAISSKIINALLFLNFLGIFYAMLTRITTHTAAAFFTFMMMITPEMLAFSALSGINVLHTVYAASGLLYTVLWFQKKDQSLLILAAILLSLNCFTRNEGIVFSGIAFLLVCFKLFKKEISWKSVLLFFGIAFFGFIYWNLFLKANQIHSGSSLIILKPFWDAEKASTIFREVKLLFLNTQYYGISILLFGLLILVNLWNIIKKGDQLPLLFATLGVILLYSLLIYQINYVFDRIENVLMFSYKRFIFSFIPLFWFYIATNKSVLWLTSKGDKLLYK